MAKIPMDSRAQMILDNMKSKSDELSNSTKKKRFQFKHRTHMPFRIRLLGFGILFGFLLLAYLVDFFCGGSIGNAANNFTDKMLEGGIHSICAFMADMTSSDWSGKELALSRLLLLGPLSYTVFAFIISIIIMGVVSIIWTHYATKHALDDGTSNFVANKF